MNIFKMLNCRNILVGALNKAPFKLSSSEVGSWQSKPYSSLCVNSNKCLSSVVALTPLNPLLVPNCGIKVKGRLKLRCKDCYLERKDGRMYVFCSSYPRHKQAAMVKRFKYSCILTYAFQSKKRPY